jgi:hypothetical protein
VQFISLVITPKQKQPKTKNKLLRQIRKQKKTNLFIFSWPVFPDFLFLPTTRRKIPPSMNYVM